MAAFAEHGFAGTTFGDVAARAGLSNGAVYHYFETKEGLFEAVIQERLVPSMAADEALLAAADAGAAVALVEQLLSRLWDTVAHPGNATLAMVALLEAPRLPAVADLFYRDVIARWRRTFDAALTRAVAVGELPADLRIESLSWAVAPMIVGAVLLLQSIGRLRGASQDDALAHRRKTDIIGLLMAGLRAETGVTGVHSDG